jgi:hypothetical protein
MGLKRKLLRGEHSMTTMHPRTAKLNKINQEASYGAEPVIVDNDGGDIGEAKPRRVAAYGLNKGGNVIRQTKGLDTYGPMA